MNALNKAPAAWSDASTLNTVRPTVREMLLRTPAFAKLPPEEQLAIANRMVKVATYMANPDGLLAGENVAQAPLVRAQAEDPVAATERRLSQAPGQVGNTFQAGAVKQGVEQFGALVQKVDFPKFVQGLIQNVFQAIVSSSLEQMRAYGELLANVAKTVDEFAQDNITDNNARDWLSGKYPDALGIDIKDNAGALAEGTPAPAPTASLAAKGDNPEQRLTEISKDVGLEKPVTDLSNPDEEARLVQSARLQMARARQQLLASMVMLGINRLVVTDGHILAKVVFDMRAQDTAARKATASMLDQKKDTSSSQAGAGYSGIFGWGMSAGFSAESTSEHMTTVQSAVDDTSESKAEVKANLTGEVRVNFKSDYFPMEKMASPQMIAAIQGRSIPPEKPVSGA